MRESRESLHVLGDNVSENHEGEPPLGDDVGENHHDREPQEVGLILLSSSRSRRRGCRDGDERDDDEVAKRIFWGDFFDRANLGFFFIKSTCSVT